MRRQVEDFIQKQDMLRPGDKVIAAVSGGADSICLLHVLAGMRESWDLELRAVHINHGLRGEEADRDEAFTARFCSRLSVPCSLKRIDVRELVEEQGLSEEEAARNLRYEVLEAEATDWEQACGQPVRIAVAHHGDDNAETILHNLFRGSGLKGLGGIRPVRGRLIRPLLTVTREEILNYLEEEGVSYCMDSTNQSEEYTRNRLRHKIMPLICSEINSRAAEHILQAAERMRQADEYLEQQAALWLKQYGIQEREQTASGQEKEPDGHGQGAASEGRRGSGRLLRSGADAGKLSREPVIIQTYVIRQMIGDLTGSRKDLTSVHVEGVRELLEKQAGKQADLPYGLTARRTYDYLWIEKKCTGEAVGWNEKQPPKVEFETFSWQKEMKIPENQYTKWFDYDKIKGTLSVRTRQTGDYFILPGGGRKTVKSYLIDEKIPAELRDSVFLLADESHILWIIGRRISEGCKVTSQTKRILQVHVSGGKENG